MTLDVNPIWLLAFLLVFVRALAWLAVVPPFSNRRVIPIPLLVGIAGGLAILAAPSIPASAVPTDTPGMIGSLLVQVFTGVALGLSIQILLTAVTSAGGLLDLFGGINLPPALDPLSENQVPLFGQLYEQVALVLLFVTNGEMMLVRAFTESFGKHAVTLRASGFLSNLFTADLATYFVATFEIAAPLIAVLFATQVGLALLAKAAPQLNVWILGFPIQAMMSLAFVAIGIRVLPGYLASILDRISQDMSGVANWH